MRTVKFGHVLVELGRYGEAETPLKSGYAILAPGPSVYAKRVETAHADLLKVYTKLGEPGKADQLIAEAKHAEAKH